MSDGTVFQPLSNLLLLLLLMVLWRLSRHPALLHSLPLQLVAELLVIKYKDMWRKSVIRPNMTKLNLAQLNQSIKSKVLLAPIANKVLIKQ